MALEVFLCGSGPDFGAKERAGAVLMLVHGRLRSSDLARGTSEPSVDVDSENEHGYIEVVLEQTKTGFGRKRRRLGFPAAALTYGVSGLDWGSAWLKTRAALGRRASQAEALVPAVVKDGVVAAGHPIGSDGMTFALREALVAAGVDRQEAQVYTSHSCKATALSWAAKAGLPIKDRRLLGGHSKSTERTALEYSRRARWASPEAQ